LAITTIETSCARPPKNARRAATFTAYDLRHLRLTKLAEAGNIIGAAYLAGHKRPSTTDRYLRPNLRAGEHALRAVGPTGFNPAVPNPVTRRNRLAGVPNPADHQSLCEGEDLNLHGSYPASTSSQRQFKFIEIFEPNGCSERHENAKARTHNRETIRETL